MANNWQINAIAGLDGTQSRNQLNSDIKGLARNLDKLKLYTEIDKNQVIQLQNQLKKLQIDLNTVTVTDAAINGIVQKINDGLKNIQISNINVGNIGNQAQQTGQQIGNNIGQQITQSISSAIQKGTMKVKSADGIKDLSKYIPNGNLLQNDVAKQALKDFQALGVGIVTVKEEMKNIDGKNLLNGFTINIKNAKGEVESLRYSLRNITDDQGNVTGQKFQYTGGSINDASAIKQIKDIENAFSDYTAKLSQFKSTNSEILSGLTAPLSDFETKLAGLKNGASTIDEVTNAYKSLNAEASNITKNFSRQLSPIDNAIRNLAKGEETISGLRAEFKGLNNAPKEINTELNKCARLLENVKKIESQEGRTENWSQAYRQWSDSVDTLQAKLKTLRKEQSNVASTQIFNTGDLKNNNIAYMSKVYNTIEKQMVEINRLAKAKDWKVVDVSGVEQADGKIKKLTLTVRDAEGALKKLDMQREKLQGNGKAQYGLMQVGDVKILETASQAQEKLARSTEKANAKLAEQANKIQLSMGVNGDTTSKIELLRNNFTKLGLSADEVKTKMSGVDAEVKTLQSLMNSGADNSAIVTQFEKLQTVLTQTQNNLKQTRSDYSLLATEQQRLSLANTIEAWNQKNTRATKEVRAENDKYIASLRDLNTEMTKMQFGKIQTGFKQAENSMRAMSRIGLAFKDQWIQAVNSFKVWVSASTAVMLLIRKIREMPQTVKELDTSLVDLKKTTSMTSSQLEEFYYNSNDVAKKMGVTTKEIIDQAAAFSRLGWSSAEAATQMAKFSSMFASISPGMNIDEATTDLTSIIKAYDVEVNDMLDGILSKINIVGNTFGTSNAEIAEGLKLSSAAMASLGGSFEENVALFTAGQEIVQDASQVGNAIRSITMRIKGYDETTEEFSENVVEATGKVADLTKVASNNNMGISMFTDASQTHYKSLVKYLGEISDIWDEIDEKSQVALLQNLFGKNRAQVGAAILQNFDTVRESLEAMENSAGNAEAEMSVIMDSLDYKLNKNKETWTGVAQNLFQRDDMKAIVDDFTSIGEAVDFATDKLGMFGTIGLGAGLLVGIRNVGGLKFRESHFEYA